MTNTPSRALPSNVEELRAQTDKALYRLTKSPAPENYYGSSLYDRDVQTLIRFASTPTPTEKEAGEREVIAKTLFDVGWPMSDWNDEGPHSSRAFCLMLADALIEKRRARSASVTDAKQDETKTQIIKQLERAVSWIDDGKTYEISVLRGLLFHAASFLRRPTPPAHGEGELREALLRIENPSGDLSLLPGWQLVEVFRGIARDALSRAPARAESGLDEIFDQIAEVRDMLNGPLSSLDKPDALTKLNSVLRAGATGEATSAMVQRAYAWSLRQDAVPPEMDYVRGLLTAALTSSTPAQAEEEA